MSRYHAAVVEIGVYRCVFFGFAAVLVDAGFEVAPEIELFPSWNEMLVIEVKDRKEKMGEWGRLTL